ncbi:MAG: hypothetical protein HOP19_24645 [Acidobacteria bacterium]|nr:hypothetical protein [Acidobacteriota bacterium]
MAEQLPLIAARARCTKPLARFLSQTHSRRIAAELIHDLCDAAFLYHRGDLTNAHIEFLLADNLILRELWEQMNRPAERPIQSVTPHPLQVTPRWQWEVKTRNLRLFFPQQTINCPSMPTTMVVKKERYPVRATWQNETWQIEPFSLAHLPLEWPEPAPFKAELLNAEGKGLRRWMIAPPSSGALFFHSNQTGLLAFYQDSEKGLAEGEYLVLLRHGLRLEQSEGNPAVLYGERPPQGFSGYVAQCQHLKPPLKVYDRYSDKDEDCLQRIPLLPETSQALRLEGELLSQADDPQGVPTYKGNPPTLLIPAESRAAVQDLQLQLRELSASHNAVTKWFSLRDLLKGRQAVWSELRRQMSVPLDGLLSQRQSGRFRVRLLHGLQRSRFAHLEFNWVPQLHIAPTEEAFAQTLFEDGVPPAVELVGPEVSHLSSTSGTVKLVMRGFYEIRWAAQQNDFTALLTFGNFQLPLRWHPHVLRARLAIKNAAASWLTEPLKFKFDDLTFERELIIQGIPDARYQIKANERNIHEGSFDKHGLLHFQLAQFKDRIKALTEPIALLRLSVRFGQRTHHLSLMWVVKETALRNGVQLGEQLAYLREGQQVLHPNYGTGQLETFVNDQIEGEAIHLARFHFFKYGGVAIYIPSTRYLPVYSGKRPLDIFVSQQPATPRVRVFTVESATVSFDATTSENQL